MGEAKPIEKSKKKEKGMHMVFYIPRCDYIYKLKVYNQ